MVAVLTLKNYENNWFNLQDYRKNKQKFYTQMNIILELVKSSTCA